MCGIAGFIDLNGTVPAEDRSQVARGMAYAVRHRGPDDEGVWCDNHAGIALAHRRLSIIDLSSNGHQPMISSSGRYVIVHNGEVYNFRELRSLLERSGSTFRGGSDTEVMLAAIEEWQLLGALGRFNGMFAFALWDRQDSRLHICRDRVGEKPLYYGLMGSTFLFGSDLPALRAHPSFRAEVDPDALDAYFRRGYVPGPFSILSGVRKVPPGTVVTVDGERSIVGEPVTYWSAHDAFERGLAEPFRGDVVEAADRLEASLREAVRLRMVADVPLGAFLSGGIDSSMIVALMQSVSTRPVRTFTVCSFDPTHDESGFARAVAAHLGTDHEELQVSAAETIAAIPDLPAMIGEPVGDTALIPTYLIARLARRKVTVGFSGDGGDELFAGYDRYRQGARMWRLLRWIPAPATRAAASLSGRITHPLGAERALEFGGLGSVEALHERLVAHWRPAPTRRPEIAGRIPDGAQTHAQWGTVEQMMYRDLTTYLPGALLMKVDRANMAVGLEGRVPFLDHNLIEFACSLPISLKVRDGRGKWLLRQVLHRYVPDSLVDRPKKGFGFPLGDWLRGPLREWAEELLSARRLQEEGYLDPRPINALWSQHLVGRADHQFRLWDVLIFQAWLESQGSMP